MNPLVSAAVWHLRNPLAPSLTPRILRFLGAEVGDGARIKRSLLIDNAITDENSTGDFSHLSIGSNTYIGDGVYFDLANEVRIGRNVTISGDASFVTHSDCNRSPWLAKQFPRESSAITVEEDTWIGFGATILPGVTIESQSVVAAGAVVTEDTSTKTVVGGCPATKVSDI